MPFLARRHGADQESGFWATVVGAVLRHPWVSAIGATAVLVLLAVPALRLHTANSGVQGLPRDLPVMKTYDRINRAFPGGPIPAVVAVRAPDVRALEVTAAIRAMRDRAVASGEFRDPLTIVNSPDRRTASVSIAITGDGTDATSNRAMLDLRRRFIPPTLGRLPGRPGGRDRPHRRVLRLQPAHEAAGAVGLPLRAVARLRAAHDDVPVDS